MLAHLDPSQLRVVGAPPGPTVVLAGAGSGKTRALVHRVARLIEGGAAPDTIVLCTFTQRAARELSTRVEALVGPIARTVRAGTIHRLAHRILEEHGGLGRYHILDRGDADQLLAECLENLPRPGPIRALYARALAEQRTLGEIIRERAPRLLDQVAALEAALDEYARKKAAAGALDFDDLLFFCKLLLVEKRPPLGVEHVLVDEYQDVTRLQAELLELLGGQLLVVGDEAQSIYSFRGADPRNLTGFRGRFPAAQIYNLDVNYRSSPEIVALANRIAKKSLIAARSSDEARRPARVELDDDRQQALFVAARLTELLSSGRRASQLAALYRTHAHGLELELELARRRIPYRVRSGARFADQSLVRDATAWLRLAVDPRDELAWSRAARQLPGVGPRGSSLIAGAGRALGLDAVHDRALAAALPLGARPALARLRALATALAPNARPERIVRAIVAELDLGDDQAALADLRALEQLAAASTSTAELLETLALSPDRDERHDAVTLSTIHQAKGLEWDVVFVLSLVEGRFPLPARDPADTEEERRLLYVAVTRARDELYLCRPMREGATVLTPSRFLLELDGLADRWSVVS